MSLRRPVTWVVLVTAALLAAGCVSKRPVEVSRAPGPVDQKRGIYKVGQPYQIDGAWYYPAEDLSYEETGIASWYGEKFHGRDTANGEVFDLNSLTAAHRTLPMPSIVQVTNLENGRTMQLRVNDRGPFARGRIIDLSRRSAQLLGFEQQGTAKVRVRILAPESIQVATIARQNGADTGRALAEAPPAAAPREVVVAQALPPPGAAVPAPPPAPTSMQPSAPPNAITYSRKPGAGAPSAPVPPAPSAPSLTAQLASAAEPPPLSDNVSVVPIAPTQIWIQAGAFATRENLSRAQARLAAVGPVRVTETRVSGMTVSRVRVGPAANVEDADRLLARVVESGFAEARIVVD
jgi:rare lipoprotein A